MRSVIKDIGEAGDIHLAAVGIGHDVGRYYAHSISTVAPNELAGAVIRIITEVLAPRRSPQQGPGQPDPTDEPI